METIAHIAGHVLEHSLADTLYLIPFLFVTYLAMEWLEHKTGGKTQEAIRHAGAAGPIVGASMSCASRTSAAATTTVTPASRLPNAPTSTTMTWSTPMSTGTVGRAS